jgi:hypothetical protein
MTDKATRAAVVVITTACRHDVSPNTPLLAQRPHRLGADLAYLTGAWGPFPEGKEAGGAKLTNLPPPRAPLIYGGG